MQAKFNPLFTSRTFQFISSIFFLITSVLCSLFRVCVSLRAYHTDMPITPIANHTDCQSHRYAYHTDMPPLVVDRVLLMVAVGLYRFKEAGTLSYSVEILTILAGERKHFSVLTGYILSLKVTRVDASEQQREPCPSQMDVGQELIRSDHLLGWGFAIQS